MGVFYEADNIWFYSTVNYPNRDVFLIFLIQTSLLTTSKSEQNCCTVFLLHVTISPQAGVNPNTSIIKQSRRSHRWWGLLQAPVVFSCLTSPSPTFQPFDLWGSVSHTWHSYTPKGWIYFTFKFDLRLHLTLYRFLCSQKEAIRSSHTHTLILNLHAENNITWWILLKAVK